MKGFGIDSGWSVQYNVGGVFERMQITLSVIINGELLSAMNEFAGNECKLAL